MPSHRFPLLIWLLVLATALGGCKPEASNTPAAAADPFEDVTQKVGLTWRNEPARRPMRLLESVGFGGGFIDFNADDAPDVVLIGGRGCGLFLNKNGTFNDVSKGSGLERPGAWTGCSVGDIDNDGLPDLFVSGYRGSALYRNRGNGTFEDITKKSGIQVSDLWATACAFSDFDRDGRLDLYVGAYCEFGPQSRQYCVLADGGVETGCRPIDYEAQRGRCYRNLGEGRFQDVTRLWGMAAVNGKCLGAAPADFNGDGWPDLFLANDEMPADLLLNEHGRFRNVAVEAGVAYSRNGQLMGGMGVDWGDINADGRLDLAVGTFESEDKVLFVNKSDHEFEFASDAAGILPSTYGDVVFGTLLFDYDGDGHLDLIFTNGHTMDNIAQVRPTVAYRQPARLFHNDGSGRFTPVPSPTLAVPCAGRGLATGDFDQDGAEDLLAIDMDGAVRLLRNRGQTGHWVRLRLEGAASNQSAIGARVTVRAGKRTQVHEVRSGRSYLSACDLPLTIGVGSASVVDEIEVRWPGGAITRRGGVHADQSLTLKEGS